MKFGTMAQIAPLQATVTLGGAEVRGNIVILVPEGERAYIFGSEKWGKFCALTPRVRSALY